MAISFFKKKKAAFDYQISRVCKTCGNMFQGRFCNHCGEKVTSPQERSILYFIESLVNAFTFLDGKFIKSLKLLFTKPGQLSRNFVDGIQVPYMKMISLFFVANFFYFFFPVFDSFNSSLYTQMNLLGGHSEVATRIVNETLVNDDISLDEFREKYQAQSTNSSKLLLILLALMFTLLLMVVNYSRKIYFFDHLLFSLEFYSFLILTCLVAIPNVLVWIIRLGSVYGKEWMFILSDSVYFPLMLSVLAYFMFRAQINFYAQKWYWALPKTLILLFLLKETWALYRKLLFYVTM